ncbi:hypothetical protein FRC12_015019 [Ceratobasidium sp. 428]|nr:hypothetical protein FRC12_015019 [Ceratobasidium sp. 428]
MNKKNSQAHKQPTSKVKALARRNVVPVELPVFLSRTGRAATTMGFNQSLKSEISKGPTGSDGGYKVSVRHFSDCLQCFDLVKSTSKCYFVQRKGSRSRLLLGTLVVTTDPPRSYEWQAKPVFETTTVVYFGDNPSYIRFEGVSKNGSDTASLQSAQTATSSIDEVEAQAAELMEDVEEEHGVEDLAGQPHDIAAGEPESLASQANSTTDESGSESNAQSESEDSDDFQVLSDGHDDVPDVSAGAGSSAVVGSGDSEMSSRSVTPEPAKGPGQVSASWTLQMDH